MWPEKYLYLFRATVSQRFFHRLKRWYRSKSLLKPPGESYHTEFRITMAHQIWIQLNNNIIIGILYWIEHKGRTRQSIATSESKNYLCYQQQPWGLNYLLLGRQLYYWNDDIYSPMFVALRTPHHINNYKVHAYTKTIYFVLFPTSR